MLHSIQKRSKTFGMELNLDKTLLVTMNRPTTEQERVCFEDGSDVKRVDTATYLGITCNSKATQIPNLTQRLGKASDTFNK